MTRCRGRLPVQRGEALTVGNTLPQAFSELEAYVADWALATRAERYAARLDRPFNELVAFYDAIAASGIGRAIADRLRADGKHVATIDLTESDTDFSYLADVTDREQIDTALAAIRAVGPCNDSGECRRSFRVSALHEPHDRGVVESRRRQPQRRFPLHPSGTARHARRRLGPHR